MTSTKLNKMSHKLFLLLALMAFSSNGSLRAQVTIGSHDKPLAGALLQLKENDNIANNSNKGLGMPRVSLTNLTPTTAAELAASMNTTGSYDLNQHIGLTVYNTNHCLKNAQGIAMGTGLFVWDGVEWQAIKGLDVAFSELPTETAANSARSDWKTAWGTKVIRHQAKANIYEEFTSAYFGTAGRWMTINLAAKAYDNGATHSQGNALILIPDGFSSGVGNYFTHWSYPNTAGAGNAQLPTEYNKNKALGYLYTWDAATAGKGGSTGENPFGATPNYEAGLPEGTAAGQQKRIQGICPTGWHLPSDYEWTALENAIIQNTSLYSSLTDINPSNPSTLLQNIEGSTGVRGTDHGKAMRDPCENFSEIAFKGTSKPTIQGGFSALMAGNTPTGGNPSNFPLSAFFWTSSANTTASAWGRYLNFDKGAVVASNTTRSNMFSVRCKKDDISVIITPNAAQQYVVTAGTYATPTTTQLTATVLATPNTNVTWSSSDPTIATVSTTGLVTSVKNGHTIITATTEDGGLTATAEIVVGCGAYVAEGQWKVFMCHNVKDDLNYTQNPMIPSQAIAGDYYQWGKKAAVATAYSSAAANPMGPGTWNTTNAVDKVWNSGTEAAPVKTANDPCPTGYRMPTNTEWQGVINTPLNKETRTGSWVNNGNFTTGAKFGDYLFLPAVGYRIYDNGSLDYRGFNGLYWSSTEYNTYANYMYISSDGAGTGNPNRTSGLSVRCIAE